MHSRLRDLSVADLSPSRSAAGDKAVEGAPAPGPPAAPGPPSPATSEEVRRRQAEEDFYAQQAMGGPVEEEERGQGMEYIEYEYRPSISLLRLSRPPGSRADTHDVQQRSLPRSRARKSTSSSAGARRAWKGGCRLLRCVRAQTSPLASADILTFAVGGLFDRRARAIGWSCVLISVACRP
jgi:hypothetical protein